LQNGKKQPNNNLTISNISAKDIANQLTKREQYLYYKININEYYLKRWEEKHKEKSPNIHNYIELINEMGFWVATSILAVTDNLDEEQDPKEMADIITKWIHVMMVLLDMNNFNSCVQIYIALNMSIISKLKKVWSLIPKNDKDKLKIIDDMINHNYREYRKELPLVNIKSPCIPIHSLFLQDLTFVEEMETIENNKINMEKLEVLAKILHTIKQCRLYIYNIEEDQDIQQFLYHRKVLSEENLNEIFQKFYQDILDEKKKKEQIKEVKKKLDKHRKSKRKITIRKKNIEKENGCNNQRK